MRLLTRFMVLLSIFVSSALFAGTQEQLLAKLNEIKALEASFVQSTMDRSGEMTSQSRGHLVVAEQGKFNIQTSEPFAQQLISDGEDFYTFDVELEQVIVRPLIKDASQVPILLLGNATPEFLDQYHITQVDEQTHSQFRLEANQTDVVFELLSLIFVADTPSAIVIKDSLGQTTEVLLTDVVLNGVVTDEQFRFELPSGVDLIDDR